MVCAVRVLTVAFYLLRRDEEPRSVFASSGVNCSNLRRITISHGAEDFLGSSGMCMSRTSRGVPSLEDNFGI
jgi:hypothetical protein